MGHEELQESLERLRVELEQLEEGDHRSRERLTALVADIERKLSDPHDAEHHDNLLANVKAAVEHFEVEHPRTTGILNHIMVTLANMGI